MGFYSKIEAALQARHRAYLKYMEYYYGREVTIYNQKKDEYSRVYGRSSGAMDGTFFNITCVIVNDDVIPLGPATAGAFTRGYLISSSDSEVQVGQIVEIHSDDGRSRRFEITGIKSYGMGTDVFHKYDIDSIGD